jgi:hypothetical protein
LILQDFKLIFDHFDPPVRKRLLTRLFILCCGNRPFNHIITVELIADLLYTQVKPMDFSQAGPAGGRRVARVEQKAVDVGGLHSQVGLSIHPYSDVWVMAALFPF